MGDGKCHCDGSGWIECENCDDGLDGHDCGDDICCCLNPEDNVTCQYCGGKGGWRCPCDEEPR